MLDKKIKWKILMLKTRDRLGAWNLVRGVGSEGLTKPVFNIKGKKKSQMRS